MICLNDTSSFIFSCAPGFDNGHNNMWGGAFQFKIRIFSSLKCQSHHCRFIFHLYWLGGKGKSKSHIQKSNFLYLFLLWYPLPRCLKEQVSPWLCKGMEMGDIRWRRDGIHLKGKTHIYHSLRQLQYLEYQQEFWRQNAQEKDLWTLLVL